MIDDVVLRVRRPKLVHRVVFSVSLLATAYVGPNGHAEERKFFAPGIFQKYMPYAEVRRSRLLKFPSMSVEGEGGMKR